MLESGSLGIVTIGLRKTQSATPVSVTRSPLIVSSGLPLHLCAFAGKFLLAIICFVSTTNAQNRLTISIPDFGQVKIDAELPPSRSWSFRNAYANALGIAERINTFQARDADAKRIAVGEYRSDVAATKISYSVNLIATVPSGVAHTSWLMDDCGYLRFSDLAPIDLESFSVRFNLPAGWTVESTIAPDANGEYQVLDPLKSVFFVGRSLRKVSGSDFDVVISGKWSFKDSEALKAATGVMQRYLAITQFKLPARSMIMIAAPPFTAKMNEWWAETRGSTAALLIEPSGKNLKQYLSIILTHELLHLWVPNALNLEGDYDWFFEGFTLYMALRMAFELKVIKFKEVLNTLARAYDSYLSQPDESSLIEASEKRWTTGGSHVYVKGMLVAFLSDLLIRKESGGKSKLEHRYRELFSARAAEQAQANEAIIRVLASSPAMSDFTKSYIEKARKLELEQVLPAYGLQVESSAKGSQLRVSRQLSPEQKQLLRSMGYRD